MLPHVPFSPKMRQVVSPGGGYCGQSWAKKGLGAHMLKESHWQA